MTNQKKDDDYIKMPLYFDKAFKCLFLRNPKFLKQLIMDYLHFDFEIKTFEIKNSEQFIENVFEKRKVLDITRELIAENYEIVTVNLGKMDKTGYNKSKENAWNIIINSKSFKEMKNSLKNIFELEDVKEFMKEEEKMQKDEVLLNDWDAEVLNESINRTEKEAARNDGLAEGMRVGEAKGEARGIKLGEKRGIKLGEKIGETKTKNNLIENMFKNGLEIPLISKITGTSIKQLQKIKTTLFL